MTVQSGTLIEPAQIAALRERLHLNKEQLGDLLELHRGHVSKLESGSQAVGEGTLAVLLRWLFSAFVIEGGEPPHPSIPVVRAGPAGVAIWDDEPELDASLLADLRARMGFKKKKDFAKVLGITYAYVHNLETGRAELGRGTLRVLLRWLYAVYGLPGGRPPHPSIPVVIAE
ncbi:MAG: hypothetical protein JWM27_3090 [Gemmatimonadetes bacterium]|nr:hypothetical protein [Gemmatimonadota bacterium]